MVALCITGSTHRQNLGDYSGAQLPHQMSQENSTSKGSPLDLPLMHGISGRIMQCKSCIQKDTFRRFVWPHLVKFGCLEVGEKSYGFPNKKNRLSSHPFCPHWADRAQNFLSLVTLLHIDCCAYVPFLRFVWKD